MYKKLITALLIVSLANASAQLHHQMLSSQGNTSVSQKGVVVTQTIGQQSVVGNFNLNNRYTFKIVYPNTNVINIWSQTNNPVNDPNAGVDGYIPIAISSTSKGWGGLEQYTPQNSTFLDGTLNPRGNWWWAIGSKNTYESSVNNFPGPGYTTPKVELWIK